MSDKQLTCRDCGTSFVFTASEQDFYRQKGFTNEPGRCPSCRAIHKANRDAGYSGGYDRPRREMHPAVCASCGAETQVPFVPRNDRPVYCSDCFQPRQRESQRSSGWDRGRSW